MAQNQETYEDHLFNTSLGDVFEAFKQYVARHPIPPSFLEHLPEDRLPFYWQNMVSAGPHPRNVRPIAGPSPITPSDVPSNQDQARWQQPPPAGPSSGNRNPQEHGWQQPPPAGPSSGNWNPQEHGWQQPPPAGPSSGNWKPQEHGRQQPPPLGPSSGIRNPQEHGRSSSPQGDIERYNRHDRHRTRSPPDRGKGDVRGSYDREHSRSPRDRRRRSRERNPPRKRSREGSPVRRSHERRRGRSPVRGRERSQSPLLGWERSRSPHDRKRSRHRHHERDRSMTPPLASGGELVEHRVSQPAGGDRRASQPAGGDRRIPHPTAGNESDSERRRSSSPVSPDDAFKNILPRFDKEFESMLEHPIEDLPPELYEMLTQTETRGLCAEYHEQVQVERKIHEKLINSAGMVFSYIAEQNKFAAREQAIIDGFLSMTHMNESLANITQKEKDLLAKTVNVLNSIHDAVDPATIIKFDSELTEFQREMERVREQRLKSIQQREDLNVRRIKMAEEILETVKAARAAEDKFNRQHDLEHRNVMDELRAARKKREDVQRKLNAALLHVSNR